MLIVATGVPCYCNHRTHNWTRTTQVGGHSFGRHYKEKDGRDTRKEECRCVGLYQLHLVKQVMQYDKNLLFASKPIAIAIVDIILMLFNVFRVLSKHTDHDCATEHGQDMLNTIGKAIDCAWSFINPDNRS